MLKFLNTRILKSTIGFNMFDLIEIVPYPFHKEVISQKLPKCIKFTSTTKSKNGLWRG